MSRAPVIAALLAAGWVAIDNAAAVRKYRAELDHTRRDLDTWSLHAHELRTWITARHPGADIPETPRT